MASTNSGKSLLAGARRSASQRAKPFAPPPAAGDAPPTPQAADDAPPPPQAPANEPAPRAVSRAAGSASQSPEAAPAAPSPRLARADSRGRAHVTKGKRMARFDLPIDLTDQLAEVAEQRRWSKVLLVEAGLRQLLAQDGETIDAACVAAREASRRG